MRRPDYLQWLRDHPAAQDAAIAAALHDPMVRARDESGIEAIEELPVGWVRPPGPKEQRRIDQKDRARERVLRHLTHGPQLPGKPIKRI